MGTILFVILRLTGLINTAVDLPILCGLISIDSIALSLLKCCKDVAGCCKK